MNRSDYSNNSHEVSGGDDGVSGQSSTSSASASDGGCNNEHDPAAVPVLSGDVVIDFGLDENISTSFGKNTISDISNTDPDHGSLDITWLYEHTYAVVGELGITGGMISVFVTDNAGMVKLHDQYCGIAEPTDVLTFDLSDEDDASAQAGCDSESAVSVSSQIVVCIDAALEQSKARHCGTVNHEILLYILHGVLHCLGYDDHGEKDFKIMHQREDEILQAVGVGKIFDSD